MATAAPTGEPRAQAKPAEPARPAPEPIPDTEATVKPEPEPEPVKEDFKFRAAPARRREPAPPASTNQASSAPAAVKPTAAQPTSRRPGFIAQVKSAIGRPDEPAAVSPTAAAAAPASTATNQAAASASTGARADEPAAVRPQATQPAAVKPQAGQPASRQPAAVKPAAQQKRRVAQPAKPPDEPEYNPGDLICGNCGAGNDPTRRFCRRCGQTLVDAIVAQKPPWYRRIFRRRQRALKAGERPAWMGDQERRSRVSWLHRFLRLQRLVAMLLIGAAFLGAGAYAFLPDVHKKVDDGINQVRRMIMPKYEPITPSTFTGDSIKDHPADMAFDAYLNTYWAVNSAGDPALTVTFDRPFDLGAVQFHSGPTDQRTMFDRPKTVELTFPNSDVKPIVLTLPDSDKDMQNAGLDAPGIQKLVITFQDFYPADQTGDHVLAITDIQFQERN
jgi:hypothetical protein